MCCRKCREEKPAPAHSACSAVVGVLYIPAESGKHGRGAGKFYEGLTYGGSDLEELSSLVVDMASVLKCGKVLERNHSKGSVHVGSITSISYRSVGIVRNIEFERTGFGMYNHRHVEKMGRFWTIRVCVCLAVAFMANYYGRKG